MGDSFSYDDWQEVNLAHILAQSQAASVEDESIWQGILESIAIADEYHKILADTKHEPASPELRSSRHAIKKKLYLLSHYEFSRELRYVPNAVPESIENDCRASLEFAPTREFIRRERFLLVDQILTRLGASEAAFRDWNEERLRSLGFVCADVWHAFWKVAEHRDFFEVGDVVARASDGVFGLHDVLERVRALPRMSFLERHERVAKLITVEDRMIVLGFLAFAAMTVDLADACNVEDDSIRADATMAVSMLYAPLLEPIDDERRTMIKSVYCELVERSCLAPETADRSLAAVGEFHGHLMQLSVPA